MFTPYLEAWQAVLCSCRATTEKPSLHLGVLFSDVAAICCISMSTGGTANDADSHDSAEHLKGKLYTCQQIVFAFEHSDRN